LENRTIRCCLKLILTALAVSVAATPASAIGSCSSVCTPTARCDQVCESNPGEFSTCGEMGYSCTNTCFPIWVDVSQVPIGVRSTGHWDDDECELINYFRVTQQDVACNQENRVVCRRQYILETCYGYGYDYRPQYPYCPNFGSSCQQFNWGSTC
jgi:hypothetical protein